MSSVVVDGRSRMSPDAVLRASGRFWFVVAALGQSAFIYFIVAFFGRRTAMGDFAGWNDKRLIDGYVAGDTVGNTMFAVHVLLAALITLGGLLQLIPQIRNRFPWFHRWTGRAFLGAAVVMAVGGLWLVWVRGTYLSVISAIAISIDALLILGFGALTLFYAMQRKIVEHRRWAMRTFLAVNGVWFLRVGIMAWVLLNQGPVGMDQSLSGPTDILLIFGSYLIPLAVLEIYFRSQRSTHAVSKLGAATLVFSMTLLMAVGIFGTVAFMWGPHL